MPEYDLFAYDPRWEEEPQAIERKRGSPARYIQRHSPSSLNLWASSPAMFVAERVLGKRFPRGAITYRGSAIEEGVAHGLLNLTCEPDECIGIARDKFAELTRYAQLSPSDAKKVASIDVMVLRALGELRPYGRPSAVQRNVSWNPEELQLPIVGLLDFEWSQHGLFIDLKTSDKLPSSVSIAHARQLALYCESDNIDARTCYVTPAKSAVYRVENIRRHREALVKIALTVERFLSLSDDPQELASYVTPNLDFYFWNSEEARQAAFEIWRI